MKIALVSLLSDNFLIAFKVFIGSLLETNPWFNLPIVLIDVGCSDKTKQECYALYPNIIFKVVHSKDYEGIDFNKTQDHLKATFYKLDMFTISNYHRIVFIDLDVLIMQDISYLFNCDCPIGAVPIYQRGSDTIGTTINSGVLVINNIFLNNNTHNTLLKIAKSKSTLNLPDQIIINHYFKKHLTLLPKKYNCEKRMILSVNPEIKKIFEDKAILHYVGMKPWQHLNPNSSIIETGYDEVNQLWKDSYRKYYGQNFNQKS